MTPGAALLVALLSQVSAGPVPQPAAAKLRLMVHAAAACTSHDDLVARITARSPRIEVVDDAALTAEVAVYAPRAGSVVADLVLASPGVEPTPRKVVARSCAEVADGVALIIAVTLDPNLRRGPGAAGGEPPRPALPSAGPVAAPAPPAAAVTPSEAAGGPAPAATVVVRPPAPPFPRSPPTRRLGVTLAAQAILGAAPAILPGLALYGTAALDRPGPWAPAVSVGVMHLWRSDLTEPGGAASFTLDAASVDACPLRLRWSNLEARPCASALLGRLASQGSNTPGARAPLARSARPAPR